MSAAVVLKPHFHLFVCYPRLGVLIRIALRLFHFGKPQRGKSQPYDPGQDQHDGSDSARPAYRWLIHGCIPSANRPAVRK